MESWLPYVGLLGLLASVIVLAWLIGHHARRGWKDQRWIWDEANSRALLFLLLFAVMIAGEVSRFGLTDKVAYFVWTGLGFVALPYIAYITGRLLGIWHRSRDSSRLY